MRITISIITVLFLLFSTSACSSGGNPMVSENPFNQYDIVDMLDLNLSPSSVYFEGNYAYFSNSFNINVFNTSDPLNPTWFKNIDTGKLIHNIVDVSENYGYIISSNITGDKYCFHINDYSFDIANLEPLESASIVNSIVLISMPDCFSSKLTDFYVSKGYAYAITTKFDFAFPDGYTIPGISDFYIIDIDPIESAYIVNDIKFNSGRLINVDISENYAYIIDSNSFHIVDIGSPESAYIVKSIEKTKNDSIIPFLGYVSEGYAYTIDINGFNIIDVSQPESAYIVKSIELPQESKNVYSSEGYTYVVSYVFNDASYNGQISFHIIDNDPPESAYMVKSIELPIAVSARIDSNYRVIKDYVPIVRLLNGYAYLTDSKGLSIIDIDPPESATFLKSISGGNGSIDNILFHKDYAYAFNGNGFYIVQMDSPEATDILKYIMTKTSQTDHPGFVYDMNFYYHYWWYFL